MPFPAWLPTLILVPIVGLLMYRRFRRTFGRQRVSPARMIARMLLLGAVSALFVASLGSPQAVAAALGGAFAGALLAIFGVTKTRFEATADGRFYTPNGWIGLAVSALFVGRIVARFVTLSFASAADRLALAGQPPLAALQRSPLTLGIFFVMATYYVVYYAGVLWRSRALASPAPTL